MERVWLKIGEAASRIGASPKELRYWEQLIPEIQPRRSRGNLRYYHVDELPRLVRIHDWLQEGLTVADCRELMLTGQLARGLDLGLDLGESPTRTPPRARPGKAPQAAAKAAQGAAKPPGLAQVTSALRKLVAQLSAPPRGAGARS